MIYTIRNKFISWLRYFFGYIIFASAVTYALTNAPKEIWQINSFWLATVVLFIFLMLPLELLQFFIFLRHNKIKSDILIPIQFTIRKSIYNSIFPARTGTFLFIYLVNKHYQLQWHSYFRFMVVCSVISLFVSGLALLFVILPLHLSIIATNLLILCAIIVQTALKKTYYKNTILLLILSSLSYISRLFIFWCLLMGLGLQIKFLDASYFAIATNILAQISITPGNMGVREALFAFLSPFLEIPKSVGILVGAAFQILRMLVYFLILVLVELIIKKGSHHQNT